MDTTRLGFVLLAVGYALFVLSKLPQEVFVVGAALLLMLGYAFMAIRRR